MKIKIRKSTYIGIEKIEARWGFYFTIPAILFFSVFSFYPIINAFYTSLFDKMTLSLAKPKFMGLGNYIYILKSADFWNSIRATFIFTLGTFVPIVVISLLLAVFIMMVSRKKVRGFLQIAYYTPAVISSVVAAAIWMLMMDPRGLANQLLNFIMNTPGTDHKWLADATMVQLSTMIIYFWKYIGYFVVLFITGLASIPSTIFEAAVIDGSNRWNTFWRITLPLLKPTVVLVSIMAMLQCLKTFSTQYLLFQGGAPKDPINVITLNIYTTGIRNQRIGRASAMSIVLFLIMLLFTWLQFRTSKTEEVEY
ncbi:MAG: sugar ABC transporter permease [Sphaerochaetaceae bacterium]|jgi:multiple sugar transport system permease protein|nr:sugar ABC transporter permease [Sphaerochaetaceae bacterium]MDX9809999.1 sugar ABC transporter permease [Sphaerochaetaceae bacterium]